MALNTPKQLVSAYKKHGSLKAAARETETSWGTAHRLYDQALAEGLMDRLPRGAKTIQHIAKVVKGEVKVKEKPIIEGKRKALAIKPLELKDGAVTRFFFTCAQNNTPIHEKLWENMHVLAEHYDARIHISRFAYIKSGLGARGDKAHWFGTQLSGEKYDNGKSMWFDPRIEQYISDKRVEVAPGLVWVGDANILPTRANPLSGKETLTGRKSGIFPHVKYAMDSIATEAGQDTKFNYTTGTITLRNYIQRDAGLMAEFHHCFGFLLVEVDSEGNWWCRQVNADSEGTICYLDMMVKNGELTSGNRVKAITWGDIHEDQLDPVCRQVYWGEGGMLDVLRPEYQFMHDVLDFYRRNHHEINDPHALFLRRVQGKEDVKDEIINASLFLEDAMRPWCMTVVVNSNHDRALMTWLKNRTAMFDPENFRFWSHMNDRVLSFIQEHHRTPIVFREAYLDATGQKTEPKGLKFLAQDEGFIICPNAGGGIECGDHLDFGPNGSRAKNGSFAKIGRKINGGHTHSAGIYGGEYRAGACIISRPGYVHGPSSWSHSEIVTYVNGKRAIFTLYAGKWRA